MRTLAARGLEWTRIAALADSLELENVDDTKAATAQAFRRADGRWQVACSSSLEIVMAHALLDRRVLIERVASPPSSGVALEPSMLHSGWKRWSVPEYAPAPSTLQPEEGWACFEANTGGSGGRGLLDPLVVMSSRDAEPVCWPKAWHFVQKSRGLDAEEWTRVFGEVPVRWVAEARRWSAGNRHRLIAARLTGRALPVRIASKSLRPKQEVVAAVGSHVID